MRASLQNTCTRPLRLQALMSPMLLLTSSTRLAHQSFYLAWHTFQLCCSRCNFCHPGSPPDGMLPLFPCRALPSDAGQRFLGLPTLSSEYSTLLGELYRYHTTPGLRLQLQDLTANNLLVDDSGKGMRLLFSDPAMALPTSVLQRSEPGCDGLPSAGTRLSMLGYHSSHSLRLLMRSALVFIQVQLHLLLFSCSLSCRRGDILGTWLWGSMLARNSRFDPTADLYSLSFVFVEASWRQGDGHGRWGVLVGVRPPPSVALPWCSVQQQVEAYWGQNCCQSLDLIEDWCKLLISR